MSDTKKILIVDDDEDILDFLGHNLKEEGFDVSIAKNGFLALNILEQNKPDLIILDIMMPIMDGIETCKKIRENTEYDSVIIVFLTAKDEDYIQIIALETGGDDFIIKPIRIGVLLSRMKGLLRRNVKIFLQENEENHIIYHKDLMIDKEKLLVFKEGEILDLTKKEFDILSLLASRLGKVYTREEIYLRVWNGELVAGDRTIDVHIRNLREKIGESNIGTVKGIGYRMA